MDVATGDSFSSVSRTCVQYQIDDYIETEPVREGEMRVTKIELRDRRTPIITEKGLLGQSAHEYMLMGQRGPGWVISIHLF